MALTNSQFDAIMREYDSLRAQHNYELLKRTEEVYETIPKYKELDESVSSVGYAYILKAMDGDKNASNAAKIDLRNIRVQKEELLLQHGYPVDYLAPKYTCNNCKDTGFINNKQCECLKKKIPDIPVQIGMMYLPKAKLHKLLTYGDLY